jgi:DNA-binding GntR family transcriptional regulator
MIGQESAGAPVMQPLNTNRGPSLAVLATEKIREAIICGELQLGEALSEDRLAATLGVSRTPVREALTSLQLQGLITIQPQRGSFVFQPTEEDIAELCAFRIWTETRAMWLACARSRDALVRDMAEAQARMEAAIAGGDDRASTRADADIHNAFFVHCGNQFLAESYGLISGRMSAIRSLLLHPQATRTRTLEEHREIIDALAKGEPSQAEAILASHIIAIRAGYRKVMRISETAK